VLQSFLKKKSVETTVKKLREILATNSKSGANLKVATGGAGKEPLNGATQPLSPRH
jgi:hypothetical protein